MALANSVAADVLKNQNVRDSLIKNLGNFQALSQSNSRLPKTLAQIETDAEALCTLLVTAGAITSFVA